MKQLTIIVPTYNRHELCKITIRSILEKVDHEKTEVLLMDDGSGTETLNVLEKFENENKNVIKLYKLAHGGVSNARNEGIKKASGRYVLFFDSDDIFETEKINEYCDMMDEAGADICEGDYRYLKVDTYLKSNMPVKNETIEKKELYKLMRYNYIHPTKIYRKELALSIMPMFDDDIKWGEDMIAFHKILNSANKAITVSDIFFSYRLYDGSTSKKYHGYQDLDFIEGIHRIMKMYENNALYKKEYIPTAIASCRGGIEKARLHSSKQERKAIIEAFIKEEKTLEGLYDSKEIREEQKKYRKVISRKYMYELQIPTAIYRSLRRVKKSYMAAKAKHGIK